MSDNVKLIEVGPRDGLQNETTVLSIAQKVQFIDLLSKTGLKTIEAGSFVSPKWVPQMATSHEVFQSIVRTAGVTYSALTPNMKGLEQAITASVDEVAIFTAASETFCQKNINCSIEQSIERFIPLMALAKAHNLKVRGYVSCVMGCPYEGAISHKQVADTVKQLVNIGCYEISLGDTIGVGTAHNVKALIKGLTNEIDVSQLAVHFHDTYGQALANIYASLETGIRTVDASAAGLGGCPYAKGASGNVATEDVVYMLNGLGLNSGVDLNQLIDAGRYICQQLNRQNGSKVAIAHPTK
ncbi:hydroxymethylglutaryl-CoA lyase [Alkalimarinus alittae]|uniref:Hydroxymethylglutaryl-CoA lyase n=1 Tax=Alkalimarinus alittae TaxID=2961619 RepID=A0ABY6MXB4_9ALTE|nr:hydroxymethylglutaryl-CoA lyase [Alkalimarinus alittae]UZE94464.1 hydroxymethylglutaryl-CoA lyase [Alkalimarinus alittae]